MEDMFYPSTVDEWTGTHLQPMKNKLLEIKQTADNQIKINSR